MLTGRTIVLGVCGGIAAYKAASLCSKLVQAGAIVRVIMTENARQFVAPLTFQALSRDIVISDTFAEADAKVVSHIDWADHADLFVIAPATANMIGKMAMGLADDMLSTTLLATPAPIIVAPAMNGKMYYHPAVQHNMQLLADRGVRFVEPGEGLLACGYVGKGRLAEPDEIYNAVERMLSSSGGDIPLALPSESSRSMEGMRVLVTAGGTIERLDPVRYFSNDSSGKMGFAIAEAARDRGAKVTLICARTSAPIPEGVEVITVASALNMLAACNAFKQKYLMTPSFNRCINALEHSLLLHR